MRSTAIIFFLISFLSVQAVRAQSNELMIEGQTGKLYLVHAVAAKENWYSIGRLFNVSPKEIAPFNHLVMTQPLAIGQEIQIPLTAVNFSQNGIKAPTETLVPLYHIIQEKEWFYRISVNHNKVPVASLEKWNNINKDQAKAGMHLIVGFLKVKTAQSALATAAGSAPVAVNPGTPATTAPPAAGGAAAPAVNGTTTTVRPPANTPPPVTNTTPNMASSNTKMPAARDNKPAMSNTPTPTAKTQGEVAVTPSETKSTPAINFKGGFFKADYTETGKSTGGMGGTFKSTSGWQDGRYYALMNNLPVGTIVKVTVTSSGKTIYAKVLGQLPDMKESTGMTIRVSNAAASELGQGEGKFNTEIKY